MIDLVVVDTGGANLASVQYAAERLGASATVTRDPLRLRDATHVILPGVGAAGHAMRQVVSSGLEREIRDLGVPVLGICLGMQLLFERTEENASRCLGLLAGSVSKLRGNGLPLPHMGWNRLHLQRASPLLDGIPDGAHMYFVHGYAAPVTSDTIATTEYGETFAAVVQRGRTFGVQFHPERSGPAGARLLMNFLGLPYAAAEATGPKDTPCS